jgi:hypothetical protein
MHQLFVGGRILSSGRVKNVLLVCLTGCGAHLASYPMGVEGSFSDVKPAGT